MAVEGVTWIGALARVIGAAFPRWDVCEPTCEGVKFRGSFFRRGVRVVKIKPGIYWYWPPTSRVQVIPVVKQTLNLPVQSLETLDGKPLAVSVTIVYEISDVEKALTKIHDHDQTVRDVGQASAVDRVVTRRWTEFRSDFADGKIESELLEHSKSLLRKYGVRVLEAYLTDSTKHTPVRVFGQAELIPGIIEEE